MKYDIDKLFAKLTDNKTPKSMKNFDAEGYRQEHSKRKVVVVRPSIIENILASMNGQN